MVVLSIDTLTILISFILFFSGKLSYFPIFILAGQTIFILGLVSLSATFTYFFFIGKTNKLFIPSLVLLGVGIILTFLSWFVGGLVVLVALLLLLLSKEAHWAHILPFSLIFGGFSIMAVLPSIEALLSLSNPFLDYILIIISTVAIIGGLYISIRARVTMEAHIGYLLLALSFFLLPPYHEIFGIKSNGSYGIYDTAIILLSTLTYALFLGDVMYILWNREDMKRDIEKGYAYLDEGNPSAAYALFKRIYEKDRFNEEILNGLAIALMRMGKFEESEGYLRELLKISNRDIYLANLGNLYYRMGNTEKAIKIYGEVLKKNPKCYVALNNLARCLMDKGETEKAAMLLKRALEINPHNEIANRNYYMLVTASNKKEIEEGII